MYKKSLLAFAGLGVASSAMAAASPSLEEMWALIQQQQAEIAQLKSKLSETEQRVTKTEEKTEATFQAVEEVSAGPVAKLADWADKTTIGGYGEVHYTDITSGNSPDENDQIDMHRFVVYFGHQFRDDLRFYSELEVEHSVASSEDKGEVEVEQAYVEWDYAQNHRVKAGSFLMPVGIINETHEPDTFYGVERNSVEHDILPVTWWEGGVMFSGELMSGLSYDLGIHSGLFLDPAEGAWEIREGRQEAMEARANDLAYTGRLKYTGIPGLELSTSLQYQSDLWQGETYAGQDNVDALLWEVHAIYNHGPFGLRALYARWDIDDAIETIQTGADKQEGFYVEPSYKLTDRLGMFVRYSEWDNQAGANENSEKQQYNLGVNYWLDEHVVLKADLMRQELEAGDELRGFNLGVGWSF